MNLNKTSASDLPIHNIFCYLLYLLFCISSKNCKFCRTSGMLCQKSKKSLNLFCKASCNTKRDCCIFEKISKNTLIKTDKKHQQQKKIKCVTDDSRFTSNHIKELKEKKICLLLKL